MAIKLRRTPLDLTGKTSELTFQEMNNNLKSFYYSSSFDTSTKVLELNFLSGSTSHSIDLSSLVDTVDTGSFLFSGSYNNSTNELTLYSADQNYIVDLTDLQDITDTGSFYISSSVANNVITFYQGDGTTESVTVDTGSSVTVPGNDREVLFNDNGNLGTSGSFTFQDTGIIRQHTIDGTRGGATLGSLKVSGSLFAQLLMNNVAITHDPAKNHVRLPGSGYSFQNTFVLQASPTLTTDLGRFAFGSDIQNADKFLVRLMKADTAAENAFKVEVSGSGDTTGEGAFFIDRNGKLFAPRLDNRSEPYVLGYSVNDGEITYLSTGSFGGGGSTSPGGADTQVQFNDGGSFGGDSGLTYNKTNDTLTITSTVSNPSLKFSTAFPPVAPQPGFVFSELQAYSQTYSKEVGSVQFQLDTTSGTYSTTNIPSKFIIQTTPDGTSTPSTKLQVKEDGQLVLDEYGTGTHTGTAAKWLAVDSAGNVIEENAPSGGGTTDYVSNVTLTGTSLAFTGVGSAFNSTVNLANLTGSDEVNMRRLINPVDDITYTVDSNTTEVVIGDNTPAGSSKIDEINGRTILINQDNTINGTLRFGFFTWTGNINNPTSKLAFECTGYNIGQDDFDLGVYLPQGSWDIYQIGHCNGGGNLISEYELNISIGVSGAPRYFTRQVQKGGMFKVYYNYFHKKVVIWCSHWSGAFAASGAVTFSGTDPN